MFTWMCATMRLSTKLTMKCLPLSMWSLLVRWVIEWTWNALIWWCSMGSEFCGLKTLHFSNPRTGLQVPWLQPHEALRRVLEIWTQGLKLKYQLLHTLSHLLSSLLVIFKGMKCFSKKYFECIFFSETDFLKHNLTKISMVPVHVSIFLMINSYGWWAKT